jgi:hypothetical protein
MTIHRFLPSIRDFCSVVTCIFLSIWVYCPERQGHIMRAWAQSCRGMEARIITALSRTFAAVIGGAEPRITSAMERRERGIDASGSLVRRFGAARGSGAVHDYLLDARSNCHYWDAWHQLRINYPCWRGAVEWITAYGDVTEFVLGVGSHTPRPCTMYSCVPSRPKRRNAPKECASVIGHPTVISRAVPASAGAVSKPAKYSSNNRWTKM